MNNNTANNEYEIALKHECEVLKQNFTYKQLLFASWLYVYALDCEDEIAKEKYPACKAMLEAMDRLYEISEKLGLEAEIDNDVYVELDIGNDEKTTLEKLEL
jgi:hypothetical protein